MDYFSNPWKHQKILQFWGALEKNGLQDSVFISSPRKLFLCVSSLGKPTMCNLTDYCSHKLARPVFFLQNTYLILILLIIRK